MKELLKILNFDCKLERFAEVFGDDVESEDINGFLKVAPLTPEELEKARNSNLFYSVGTPEGEFEALDIATQSKLNICRESAGLEPADLQILRAFFRFVNDAYGWNDIGDLERWETELFDTLNGYHQKNYEPLTLNEDTESRFALLCQFVLYLIEYYAELTVEYTLNYVAEDIAEDNGRLWKFYQTHKKEEF